MVLTLSGFVLQTQGLKHGSALVVCTLAAEGAMREGKRHGGRGEGRGERGDGCDLNAITQVAPKRGFVVL